MLAEEEEEEWPAEVLEEEAGAESEVVEDEDLWDYRTTGLQEGEHVALHVSCHKHAKDRRDRQSPHARRRSCAHCT